MLTLLRSLQDHDLGHLRAVAELWGIDLPSGSAKEAAAALTRAMLESQAAHDQVEGLGPDARQALDFLISRGGHHPLADAERRFGPIRQLGPARRDREKPWRTPASPLEDLWYRSLVARAFGDTPSGPQEFLFIPTDLLPLLPPVPNQAELPLGRPAPAPPWRSPAGLGAADDATTLLAALRRRSARMLPLPADRVHWLARFLEQPASIDLLSTLLYESSVLCGPPIQPQADAARAFLDLPRLQAVQHLFQAWEGSTAWNDLAHLPSLAVASAAWPNDPQLARREVLSFLRRLSPGTWWHLEAFVSAVREARPGFQRPAGDFDSWYLRHAETGAFLQGFEHWDEVEGALLRSLIRGPLHWLGLLDVGGPSSEQPSTVFRLSQHASALLDPANVEVSPEPRSARASLTPDGSLRLPPMVPRALRYQIARFTVWTGFDQKGWHFRLTPSALQAGRAQGLQLSHLRAVLEAACQQPLPPTLLSALERWDRQGSEARLERALVLRLANPGVLRELKRNKATGRYLGDDLGPTCVLVRERDWDDLCRAAARIGLLVDPPADEQTSP
ncbi:MAG: hypothetical protein AB1449_01740 [Chloroflexota bacterium]